MTERNNQRDNNNTAPSIHKKNKNPRNNNTNNNDEILNIKSKYEITNLKNTMSEEKQEVIDENSMKMTEINIRNQEDSRNFSGIRSGDQYEGLVSLVRGEVNSPSGSRSGDQNDGHGIPQKVKGYSEFKLSGSRSGDQCEGTDNQLRGAKDYLSGSRSEDLREGKAMPKDGYGESKLSGSRGGDPNGGQGNELKTLVSGEGDPARYLT